MAPSTRSRRTISTRPSGPRHRSQIRSICAFARAAAASAAARCGRPRPGKLDRGDSSPDRARRAAPRGDRTASAAGSDWPQSRSARRRARRRGFSGNPTSTTRSRDGKINAASVATATHTQRRPNRRRGASDLVGGSKRAQRNRDCDEECRASGRPDHRGAATWSRISAMIRSPARSPRSRRSAPEGDAMAQHRHCEGLDVVGDDKVAALERREGAARRCQHVGGARRGADLKGRMRRVARTTSTM